MPERPGGAPFINGLPQSVIDRYERSQKTASKSSMEFRHSVETADPGNPAGAQIGRVDALLGDRVVGSLHWWMGDRPRVRGVQVEPEHRRQGIATRLWQEARQIEPSLRHSLSQTDDGDAWVKSLD